MMLLRDKLDYVYSEYNRREYVDPDPLLFLYNYSEKKDIEIAGFIASCLAYGRVEQIMKTVNSVLNVLNPSPFEYLTTRSKASIARDFRGFSYRFTKDIHLINFLWGIKDVINCFSSIENCFCVGWSSNDDTLVSGLAFLYDWIAKRYDLVSGHLFADPRKKSACKRSHLFLRWMVRKDDVDLGIWEKPLTSQLIVPLDTHMYKTGVILGFTRRKSKDFKTALEITKGFRNIYRKDPVKYDFCLTRFGIRRSLDISDLARFFHEPGSHGSFL